MKCGFCDKRCPGHERLGRHVLAAHSYEEVAGRKLDRRYGDGHSLIRCWCGLLVSTDGRWVYPGDPISLGMHLKERGGLDAHILELVLGIHQEVRE